MAELFTASCWNGDDSYVTHGKWRHKTSSLSSNGRRNLSIFGHYTNFYASPVSKSTYSRKIVGWVAAQLVNFLNVHSKRSKSCCDSCGIFFYPVEQYNGHAKKIKYYWYMNKVLKFLEIPPPTRLHLNSPAGSSESWQFGKF